MQDGLPTERSFGLTFAAVFAIVGAWLVWKGSPYWILAVAAAAMFLLAAFAFPKVLHPLNVAWMRLGRLLNWVVSPVVMGVIFFGVLTPVAMLMRLRGRDALHRKFDSRSASYWISRDPPGPEGPSFQRQY